MKTTLFTLIATILISNSQVLTAQEDSCAGIPQVGMFDTNYLESDLVNGYCDPYGYWVPGLITKSTWHQFPPQHIQGNATWYDMGVMEAVMDLKGIDRSLYLGGIAVMFCPYQGEPFPGYAWIRRAGYDWEGPYAPSDCPHLHHAFSHVEYFGNVIEVDYETAIRWGMVQIHPDGGRTVLSWQMIGVEVFFGPQPPIGSVAVDYVSWWKEMARLTVGSQTVGYSEAWRINPPPWSR